MADKPSQDKTEQPTAERLRKARQEGRIPESQELPSALMLLMLTLVLAVGGGWLFEHLAGEFSKGLAVRLGHPMTQEDFTHLLRVKGMQALIIVSPFALGALAVSMLGSVVTSGWSVSTKALKFDLEKINPFKGFGNLISLKSVVQLVTSMTKVTVVAMVTWYSMRDEIPRLSALTWQDPQAMMASSGRLLLSVLARITLALLVIGGLDVLYQKWNHRRQLKMTRQEVKEENKEHEQSGEIKGRVRSIQYALARRRMLSDVAAADVVVANPTHVAVALKYDSMQMAAPIVVAKGADLMCEKIKEIARLHDVPVVTRPELARGLFAAADIGEAVPDSLFVAVAEVLAMIYRMRGVAARRRRTAGGAQR